MHLNFLLWLGAKTKFSTCWRQGLCVCNEELSAHVYSGGSNAKGAMVYGAKASISKGKKKKTQVGPR